MKISNQPDDLLNLVDQAKGSSMQCRWIDIGKYSDGTALHAVIDELISGIDVGLISDCGAPGIADPGAALVKLAHRTWLSGSFQYAGPSSIFLALMASGLNGQSFPISRLFTCQKGRERERQLGQCYRNFLDRGQTQIFIETPYRNMCSCIRTLFKKIESWNQVMPRLVSIGSEQVNGLKQNQLRIGKKHRHTRYTQKTSCIS